MNGVSMTMTFFNFSNKPTLFCLCHIQSVKHQYMMIVLCQRYYVTFHGYFKSTAPWVKKNKLYCMHITIRDMKKTTSDKQRYKWIEQFTSILLHLGTQTERQVGHLYHKQQRGIDFHVNRQSKHLQHRIYRCRWGNRLLVHFQFSWWIVHLRLLQRRYDLMEK